jgi:hypothetical protein
LSTKAPLIAGFSGFRDRSVARVGRFLGYARRDVERLKPWRSTTSGQTPAAVSFGITPRVAGERR